MLFDVNVISSDREKEHWVLLKKKKKHNKISKLKKKNSISPIKNGEAISSSPLIRQRSFNDWTKIDQNQNVGSSNLTIIQSLESSKQQKNFVYSAILYVYEEDNENSSPEHEIVSSSNNDDGKQFVRKFVAFDGKELKQFRRHGRNFTHMMTEKSFLLSPDSVVKYTTKTIFSNLSFCGFSLSQPPPKSNFSAFRNEDDEEKMKLFQKEHFFFTESAENARKWTILLNHRINLLKNKRKIKRKQCKLFQKDPEMEQKIRKVFIDKLTNCFVPLKDSNSENNNSIDFKKIDSILEKSSSSAVSVNFSMFSPFSEINLNMNMDQKDMSEETKNYQGIVYLYLNYLSCAFEIEKMKTDHQYFSDSISATNKQLLEEEEEDASNIPDSIAATNKQLLDEEEDASNIPETLEINETNTENDHIARSNPKNAIICRKKFVDCLNVFIQKQMDISTIYLNSILSTCLDYLKNPLQFSNHDSAQEESRKPLQDNFLIDFSQKLIELQELEEKTLVLVEDVKAEVYLLLSSGISEFQKLQNLLKKYLSFDNSGDLLVKPKISDNLINLNNLTNNLRTNQLTSVEKIKNDLLLGYIKLCELIITSLSEKLFVLRCTGKNLIPSDSFFGPFFSGIYILASSDPLIFVLEQIEQEIEKKTSSFLKNDPVNFENLDGFSLVSLKILETKFFKMVKTNSKQYHQILSEIQKQLENQIITIEVKQKKQNFLFFKNSLLQNEEIIQQKSEIEEYAHIQILQHLHEVLILKKKFIDDELIETKLFLDSINLNFSEESKKVDSKSFCSGILNFQIEDVPKILETKFQQRTSDLIEYLFEKIDENDGFFLLFFAFFLIF